ncbi:MAG: zf-HC2 domain-containing protein [Candidatus Latescibacteria bacterium]|nr:zf-HC2 domain-containing protein [Candidatus Latescibacterota bacterium]
MTKHKEFEELIQKCLDREITVDENISLQLHLSQCPDCSLFYNELVSAEKEIIDMVEVVPNHGFNEAVLARIKTKKVPAWAKIATVLGSAWVVSFLAFILIPASRDLFTRILFSSPSIVKAVAKIYFVGSTLARIVTPFAKSQLNPTLLVVSILLSVGMFIFFGKLFSKKETVWNT